MAPQTDLEKLAGQAAALAGNALSTFEFAAADLEEAARSQEVIAELAEEQIDVLTAQRDHALDQADSNRSAARGLRSLIGVSE